MNSEQRKYRAASFDRLTTVVITAGVIAPAASAMTASQHTIPLTINLTLAAGSVVLGFVLHYIGHWLLRSIGQ